MSRTANQPRGLGWLPDVILAILSWIVLVGAPAFAQDFEPGCPIPFHDIQGSHDFDENCGIEGTKRNGGQLSAAKKAENLAKNNFCASGQALPISMSTFLRLQTKTNDVRESELDDRSDELADLVTVA